MAYPALPDQRMAYDNDGTVVGTAGGAAYTSGVTSYASGANLISVQSPTWNVSSGYAGFEVSANSGVAIWFFFPEQREVTGLFVGYSGASGSAAASDLKGSNDTTNGLDGTWETASLPGGAPFMTYTQMDNFRSSVKAVSFTGGKRVIRMAWWNTNFEQSFIRQIHIYGEKAAGQTPDDIIYIDHDTTPGVEYTAPEDFGDRPLATTVTRQFRVKNASATKTANTINIQCNDADFVISTDGTTWVVTINIGSLGPGAESSTMYVRNTTPAVGSPLGPRFSRIVALVGSWT